MWCGGLRARRIRVHGRGGSVSVKEEGKQKAKEKKGSKGGVRDAGGTLHGEGLFLFFWQAPLNCTLYSLPINQM